MTKFSDDLKKYKKYSGKPALILMLTHQGLWVLFFYRINNFIYSSRIPTFFKRILLLPAVIIQKFLEILTGISLPYSAQIGREFYIGHFGNIIINSKVVIGNNCNISQGVTIGVSGRGTNRGVPVIGDNVFIGVNAVIAGAIKIGNNVVVGANSLVTESVEPNITVVGVPAVKVSENNSEQYI